MAATPESCGARDSVEALELEADTETEAEAEAEPEPEQAEAATATATVAQQAAGMSELDSMPAARLDPTSDEQQKEKYVASALSK